MYFRTSDGLELYFELSGKGIPCVYLHGGPGYWSKSFQHFSGELLEEHLQMVYLDQRGCGRSEHSPLQDYSLSRLINDIEELRMFLGIEKWFLLGHSFGGILAVNYASYYPKQTQGIILSNATLNMFKSFTHQIQRGSEVLGVEGKDVSMQKINALMDTYYSILMPLLEKEKYFKFQYKAIENKMKMDVIDQDELNSDPHFQQYVFSSDEYFQDFISITESIHKPVLVITGKDDHAVGPDHYQSFCFPKSEVIVLDSGHHPYIETPLEYKKAVLQFVKGQNY